MSSIFALGEGATPAKVAVGLMSLVVLVSLPKARSKDPALKLVVPSDIPAREPAQENPSLHLRASTVCRSDTSSWSSNKKIHFFRKWAPLRTLTSSFVDGGGSEFPILGFLFRFESE